MNAQRAVILLLKRSGCVRPMAGLRILMALLAAERWGLVWDWGCALRLFRTATSTALRHRRGANDAPHLSFPHLHLVVIRLHQPCDHRIFLC